MTFSSSEYWENRYYSGGNSGVGSYAKFADFKAEFVNYIIKKNNIKSIVELGVGDGNQLSKIRVQNYIGIDVSKTAVARCTELFKDDTSKSFYLATDVGLSSKAEMSLSMDVIYHLVEDDVYDKYMSDLFNLSKKFVTIYSSNTISQLDNRHTAHVKHRRFSDWIESYAPNARLIYFKKNMFPYNGNYKVSSFSDFYVYQIA